MARQRGIRLKLSLFIPFARNNLDQHMAAISAAKKLRTREGLCGLAEFPDVEIEDAETVETTRGVEDIPKAAE